MYRDARLGTAQCLRRGIGVVCLGLGFVGLLLPLVPGIPLLIVGGLLLRRRASQHGDRSGAVLPRGKSVNRLSGMERMQLRFWMFCGAVTTRLDRRSRAVLRSRRD